MEFTFFKKNRKSREMYQENQLERMQFMGEKLGWQVEKIQWQMDRLKQEMDRFQHQGEQFSEERETLKDDLDGIKAFTHEIKGDFLQFSNQLEDLQSVSVQLEGQLKGLDQFNGLLTGQVEELKTQLHRVDGENESVQKTMEIIAGQIGGMEDQIQKLLRFFYKFGNDINGQVDGLKSTLKQVTDWQQKQEEEEQAVKAQDEKDASYRDALIRIVDSIDHLLSQLGERELENWGQMLKKWNQQLLTTLRKMGAHELVLKGYSFDPKQAEAVETRPATARDMLPYEIVEVIKRGFLLDDGTLLRKAQVITVQEDSFLKETPAEEEITQETEEGPSVKEESSKEEVVSDSHLYLVKDQEKTEEDDRGKKEFISPSREKDSPPMDEKDYSEAAGRGFLSEERTVIPKNRSLMEVKGKEEQTSTGVQEKDEEREVEEVEKAPLMDSPQDDSMKEEDESPLPDQEEETTVGEEEETSRHDKEERSQEDDRGKKEFISPSREKDSPPMDEKDYSEAAGRGFLSEERTVIPKNRSLVEMKLKEDQASTGVQEKDEEREVEEVEKAPLMDSPQDDSMKEEDESPLPDREEETTVGEEEETPRHDKEERSQEDDRGKKEFISPSLEKDSPPMDEKDYSEATGRGFLSEERTVIPKNRSLVEMKLKEDQASTGVQEKDEEREIEEVEKVPLMDSPQDDSMKGEDESPLPDQEEETTVGEEEGTPRHDKEERSQEEKEEERVDEKEEGKKEKSDEEKKEDVFDFIFNDMTKIDYRSW